MGVSWQHLHSAPCPPLSPINTLRPPVSGSLRVCPLASLKKAKALLAMPAGLGQILLRENSCRLALGTCLCFSWMVVQELRGCSSICLCERSWPFCGSHGVWEDILALGQSTKVLLFGLQWAGEGRMCSTQRAPVLEASKGFIYCRSSKCGRDTPCTVHCCALSPKHVLISFGEST